jgi:hypothetical protein
MGTILFKHLKAVSTVAAIGVSALLAVVAPSSADERPPLFGPRSALLALTFSAAFVATLAFMPIASHAQSTKSQAVLMSECNDRNIRESCYYVAKPFEDKALKGGSLTWDEQQVIAYYHAKACNSGLKNSCIALQLDYDDEKILGIEKEKAIIFAKKACNLGSKSSCTDAITLERDLETYEHDQRKAACYADEQKFHQLGELSDPHECWLTR